MKLYRFVVASVLFGVAGLADAQTGFELEHFRCYPIRRTDFDTKVTVGLSDQFNPGAFEEVDIFRSGRFCTPTLKIHQNQTFDIKDERQHLTFYPTFPQEAPVRIALVRNQFGQQLLYLGPPVALGVPTQKLEPPHDPPVGLDHFRCYAAHGAAAVQPVIVGLRDQFTPPNRQYVLNPVSFCNPVRKRNAAGNITPIAHAEAHLTCYATTRLPFVRETFIANQFGQEHLVLGPPDRLCVPTDKLAWVAIPDIPAPTTPDDFSAFWER